jgi:hypothetical protein
LDILKPKQIVREPVPHLLWVDSAAAIVLQMIRIQVMKICSLFVSGAVVACVSASVAQAQIAEYYVGVDGRPTNISGVYNRLPNPNFARITFLYAHAFTENVWNNHFHTLGSYTQTGPSNAPVVVNTNANNRIPEVGTRQPPLTLVPAPTNSPFAGRLISARTDEHYSDLTIRPIHALRTRTVGTNVFEYGYGSGEHVMYTSSGGRWTNSMPGAVLALELIEKSAQIGVASGTNPAIVVNPGDRHVIGPADTFEAFPLVLHAAPDAAPGSYIARFKLIDVGPTDGRTAVLESGLFVFDVRVAGAPTLTVTNSVTLTAPLVTGSMLLEGAPAVSGPWMALTNATWRIDRNGAGESAAQTGTKTAVVPQAGAMQFFRLR